MSRISDDFSARTDSDHVRGSGSPVWSSRSSIGRRRTRSVSFIDHRRRGAELNRLHGIEPAYAHVEVVSVDESIWAGGWRWDIDEITVTNPPNPASPARVELVGTVENLTTEEGRLSGNWLMLLHDGSEVESSNWDAARAAVGESSPLNYSWEVDRGPVVDDAVAPVEVSDLELVWGDERPTRARYALDGSNIRTNEPIDLGVSSFEVDGFSFDITTSELWFDPARRDSQVSAPEFAYVLFDWTVTNNSGSTDRVPTTRLLAPNGDSMGTFVLADDGDSSFEPGAVREISVRYEFNLEPGPAALTVNNNPVVEFEIPDAGG